MDCVYSHEKGFLDKSKLKRILRLIAGLGFRLYDERLSQLNESGEHEILLGLEEFREHLGGALTIPLLRDIGHQFEVNEMDASLLLRCIDLLRALDSENPA